MSDKLDELKKEAKDLGINFSANIGEAKLQEKIEAYYQSQETSEKEIQEAIEVNEVKEESEVKSAVSGKKTKGQRIQEAKNRAMKTKVVTIIDNDQRVNNQTTTCKVNCTNEYFDLGQLVLPLNMPVEVKQGHLDVLKEVKIPQHIKGQGGLARVEMRPRYTISYEDVDELK